MQAAHILASRMSGQIKKFNLMADNVANMNTPGFKRLDLDFQELVAREQGQQVGRFASNVGVRIDQSKGVLEPTGNPFDIAIVGEGFYAIDQNGQTLYTRNSHFQLDSQGALVTETGAFLLDEAGSPIVIPADSTEVHVTKDGAIADENGIIAVLATYSFDAAQQRSLQRAGNASFVPLGGVEPTTVTEPLVLQGHVEASNVNGIKETINVQDISRKYQSAAKTISSLEDLESRSIRQIGKLGQ